MDWGLILTVIGTGIAVVGFIYGFLRNFKEDINTYIDKLDGRLSNVEKELQQLNTRAAVLETRMGNLEQNMSNINSNVNYLLWREHLPPAKEANSSD
jgi:predicted PurR-regulated permease PerM